MSCKPIKPRLNKAQDPQPSKNQFRKVRIIRITIIVAIVTFATLLHLYINKSVPTNIRGALTEVGDVQLKYLNTQSTSISPLCGCFEEQSHER